MYDTSAHCSTPAGHVPTLPGFANFIDEWSQYDFCFTNFGVILESFWNIRSQVSQRKKPFSDFPACGSGMYTLS